MLCYYAYSPTFILYLTFVLVVRYLLVWNSWCSSGVIFQTNCFPSWYVIINDIVIKCHYYIDKTNITDRSPGSRWWSRVGSMSILSNSRNVLIGSRCLSVSTGLLYNTRTVPIPPWDHWTLQQLIDVNEFR